MLVRHTLPALTAILFAGCSSPMSSPTSGIRQNESLRTVAQPNPCPPAGTVVPLKKVMNPSFIKDYKGCDIVVEATFLKTGNSGYVLGKYDTSANTTFQVLEPGGAPQASLGGHSFGIFAGIPKSQSDLLFDLKHGDTILLRGAPIGEFYRDNLLVAVFHATSVTRK